MQLPRCKEHVSSNVDGTPFTLPYCQNVMACRMTTAVQQEFAWGHASCFCIALWPQQENGAEVDGIFVGALGAGCGDLVHKLVRKLVGPTSLLM